MLNKSDINRMNDVYVCIVSGSDVWLIDNQLPKGKMSEFGFNEDLAIEIGAYNGSPVVWLNEADIEQRFELTSLRDCLHFEQPLFLLISKAVQYGHMSQTMRFCPQCGGRNHLNHNQLAMQCGDCRT
jgi:NAD+ diphosphatase